VHAGTSALLVGASLVCVWVYVVFVCVCVCVCVCVLVSVLSDTQSASDYIVHSSCKDDRSASHFSLHRYMYIYMYTFTFMYTYACTHTHTHICIYIKAASPCSGGSCVQKHVCCFDDLSASVCILRATALCLNVCVCVL